MGEAAIRRTHPCFTGPAEPIVAGHTLITGRACVNGITGPEMPKPMSLHSTAERSVRAAVSGVP